MLYLYDFNALSANQVEGAFIFGEKMIDNRKKEWAIEQLQIKSNQLGRLPKKNDFDVVTLSRIKAFLGPWPRALESAGLKKPKTRGEKK